MAKAPSTQREEFDKATADAKAAFETQLAKTERLRALRLARDAAAEVPPPAVKPSPKAKPKRSVTQR